MISINGSPAQQREESYREHEHIFVGYMKAYPRSIEVPCPETISPETLANRLRKLAKELMHYRWATEFSMEAFAATWKETAVRVSAAEMVVLGPRKGKLELAIRIERPWQTHGLTIPGNPEPEILEALMLLHERGILIKGTHFPAMTPEIGEAIREAGAVRNVGMGIHPDGLPGYFMT
jgi:hypothetical protein